MTTVKLFQASTTDSSPQSPAFERSLKRAAGPVMSTRSPSGLLAAILSSMMRMGAKSSSSWSNALVSSENGKALISP